MTVETSAARRQGNRLAEWALWFAGLGGGLIWIGFGAFIATFSHPDYAPGTEPSPVESMLASAWFMLPSALHAAAVVAAAGIGRGGPWAVPLGRVVGVLLVAGLPIGLVTAGPEAILETRHLFGMPLGGENFLGVALGVQAALGALSLWSLRSSSPSAFAPMHGELRPDRRLARAGAILIGLGLWQAVLVTLTLVPRFAGGLEGDAVADVTALAIAVATFGAVSVVVGQGVLGERRWALPAVLPATLTLTAWDGLLTTSAVSSFIATERGNLIALAAGVVVLGLGLAVFVAVYRSREQFVR